MTWIFRDMKLTIDTKTWHRGRGSVGSYLLNEANGRMCCLGFYCRALGVKKKDIAGITVPFALPWFVSTKLPGWLRDYSPNSTVYALIVANDKRFGYSEKKRKEDIKSLFASKGVQVRFVEVLS